MIVIILIIIIIIIIIIISPDGTPGQCMKSGQR